MSFERIRVDGVLVIGAGLAGLSAALAAAPRRAVVISPATLSQACSSAWAQGGVAVAFGADDRPSLHAADTVAAGAGLVDAAAALLLAEAGPAAVRRLAGLGAPFDRDTEGRFVQGLEAAHSRPRIARVKGDQAGRAIMETVAAATLAAPSVEVWAPARARVLLQDDQGRVRGALIERDGRMVEVIASATVLATGGVGGLYAVTTNPPAIRGEGLGLAAMAGAAIADPEFVQFHPTAVELGIDPAPLASEALRGEGAILVDAFGVPFMAAYDPRAEMAPRDIVARAIHRQIASGRGAFLDAREAIGAEFPDQFPGVFAACMAGGVDPRIDAIPVAPAAHYHMGGIAADPQGRTTLAGLFAVGECASVGVHGANRLASNSLLEAAVFGPEAGAAAAAETDHGSSPAPARPTPDLSAPALQRLRRAMARDAGVVRDADGLGRLLAEIADIETAEGRGPALATARLIAAAALARQESRGAHYRADFPEAGQPAARTFIDQDRAEAIAAAASSATAPAQ
ncbi:MAG TPA: L-aspartate oxidase [Caulobacteraceae bacterium]|jgi:L-aspartate oxidase|nr:L-aspartate oxidase [Caulobacteraceae bacterium]